MFRKRIKGTQLPHYLDFSEDLIRNEFDFDKKEVKKETWMAYKKFLDKVHRLDPKYDPLIKFETIL